jgi:hypothetical protein
MRYVRQLLPCCVLSAMVPEVWPQSVCLADDQAQHAALEGAMKAAEEQRREADAARQQVGQLQSDMRTLMAGVSRHRAQHAGQLERLLTELHAPPHF